MKIIYPFSNSYKPFCFFRTVLPGQ